MHAPIFVLAGPIAWLLKLILMLTKFFYYFVRILMWILRRLFPRTK